MKHGYVIDSNVLFSAFISGKNVYRLLFSEYTIYLPDFAFLELEKYKQRILKKTKLNEHEFQEFALKLLSNVTVIPSMLISQSVLKRAYQLCRDIDEKDTVFIAAAIEFDLTLITNDKALYFSLQKLNFTKIALLSDIIGNLAAANKPKLP